RKQKQGRIGRGVANVFGGLLRDASDGGAYYVGTRVEAGKTTKFLINRNATEGKCPYRTFPFEAFERSLLALLKEVRPADVTGGSADETADVAVLKGELGWVRERKAALAAELLKGDLAEIAAALRQLGERESELKAKLE